MRLAPSPFHALGNDFFSELSATASANPQWIHWNHRLADELGIHDQPLELLAGNQPSSASNFAMLYAGHQFGHYVQQLGDGRALMLGHTGGVDLQLKGAGPTPYSRFADGRAVLRSSIREYLASEALHHLGIPTTRALSLIGSDETIYREQPERGAVVCRSAESFVRFGNFEVFYYRNQLPQLKTLTDFVLQEHFPQLLEADNPAAEMLNEVITRSARLAALWQANGFCHGVLNTDNMSILGLTLDYGPYGFMDHYQAGYICNHSDDAGRYAYDQQPAVVGWNLSRLAQALVPVLHDNADTAVQLANDALSRYSDAFHTAHYALCRQKLGLGSEQAQDPDLFHSLLETMQANNADFSNTFRALSSVKLLSRDSDQAFLDQFVNRQSAEEWLDNYRSRLAAELQGDSEQGNSEQSDTARQKAMQAINPKYILRNHLLQTAIEQAEKGDYAEIDKLFDIMSKPYDEQPQHQAYAANTPEWSRSLEISCSS